jgi:hypothetical protein
MTMPPGRVIAAEATSAAEAGVAETPATVAPSPAKADAFKKSRREGLLELINILLNQPLLALFPAHELSQMLTAIARYYSTREWTASMACRKRTV